eukprot:GHVL01024318.1.p1 GENE.GHVL01024318.1~~GHVL01024318.1.p1  ORF type:complete len:170 (-),score=16.74 GHVL01024318.1:567-1076(-)
MINVVHFFALTLLFLTCCICVELKFDLSTQQKKCFGEQYPKGVLLVFEFKSESSIIVTVADPSATLYTSARDSGEAKSAFTTNEAGTHMFCIQNSTRAGSTVLMKIESGAEARDYSQLARREHLEPVQVILRKAEDELQLYHANLMYMRDRDVSILLGNSRIFVLYSIF